MRSHRVGHDWSDLAAAAAAAAFLQVETLEATWVPALVMDVAKMGDSCPPPLPPPPQSALGQGYKVSLGTSLCLQGPIPEEPCRQAPAPSGTFLSLARQTPLFLFTQVSGQKERKTFWQSLDRFILTNIPGPFLPATGQVSCSAWGCLHSCPSRPPLSPWSKVAPSSWSREQMNSSSLSQEIRAVWSSTMSLLIFVPLHKTQYLALLPSSCGSLAPFSLSTSGQGSCHLFQLTPLFHNAGFGFPLLLGFRLLENLICLKTDHSMLNEETLLQLRMCSKIISINCFCFYPWRKEKTDSYFCIRLL